MNVAKLKIAELKKALKERSLPSSGNKSELVERLKTALLAEGDTSIQDEDIEAKESELLGEEDEEEEDTSLCSPQPADVELDTKLLETPTTPVAVGPATAAAAATTPAAAPAAAAVKPKKIVINREAAQTAQQTAATAIARRSSASETAAAPAAPAPADGAPPPAHKRIKLSGFTETERLAMRAEKNAASVGAVTSIKVLTAEERKAARLAKFGAAAAAATAPAPAADVDTLKKRAGRFGENVSAKVQSIADLERLQKRKERFGIVVPEEAKAKRAARFTNSALSVVDPATESKKKLRAARFGTT